MTFAEDFAPVLRGHALFTAPTGGGKSWTVGAGVEELRKNNKPFIILDTKSINHIGLWLGKNRLKDLVLFRLFRGDCHTVEQYEQIIREYPFLLVIPTGGVKTTDLKTEYIKIFEAIQNLKIPRHVIVEEIHLFCKSSLVAIPEIDWIARIGRGYKIFLWAITQRIQTFPKDLWSNCAWTCVHRFHIPQDIDYFKDVIPNFRQINNSLNPHDLLIYDHEHRTDTEYKIISGNQITRKTKHMG